MDIAVIPVALMFKKQAMHLLLAVWRELRQGLRFQQASHTEVFDVEECPLLGWNVLSSL